MALRTPVPPSYCGYRSPAVCVKPKKRVAHSFYFIIHFILSFIVILFITTFPLIVQTNLYIDFVVTICKNCRLQTVSFTSSHLEYMKDSAQCFSGSLKILQANVGFNSC